YSQFRDIHDADLENSFTEITPETVCQWTGLTDKNGKRLYKGDIFQYRKHDGYFLDDFVGVVKYKNGSFGFTVIGETSTGYFAPFPKFDELQEDFLNHIEIICNIHDKERQKQALINMIRLDEELGLYGNKTN
ncbi:MAG: YopX family protein, partial [Tissierellia bacterium]|nr:YopX family protein [Tissierellia bacterium]